MGAILSAIGFGGAVLLVSFAASSIQRSKAPYKYTPKALLE
jgi:hypothetical protein